MLTLLDWSLGILTVLYALLLMAYRYWFGKLRVFEPLETSQLAIPTRFTVIIPARNEAGNIKACVDSILAQDYPLEAIEIIVIDDFSEDDTAFMVKAIGQEQDRKSVV